jgi:methionyl-tRNA synthetase
MIFDYLALDVDEQEFFSWDHLFNGFEAFIDSTAEKDGHPLKELPPRTDFFAKHPSQFG